MNINQLRNIALHDDGLDIVKTSVDGSLEWVQMAYQLRVIDLDEVLDEYWGMEFNGYKLAAKTPRLAVGSSQSDDITNKYAEAQASEIEKTKAENDKAVAEVQAETKVVNAQGEAQANATLQQSLTPEVIQQHYIDALTQIGQNGNLVVVPEGSTPMVNVNK